MDANLMVKTLKDNAELGLYSELNDVILDVTKMVDEAGLGLSAKQIEVFSKKFYITYVFGKNDLDSMFSNTDDEIESIKEKIENYIVKLKTEKDSKKRISIQSMISKLRKKLRDLGYETKPEKIKLPKEKKISIEDLIGDEFDSKLLNFEFDEDEPINKNILVFLIQFCKGNDKVTIIELAKFILKYRKECFTDKLLNVDNVDLARDNFFDILYSISLMIENTTLKNVAKGIKSTKSLSLSDINTLKTFEELIWSSIDDKLVKKIAKCSTIKQAYTLLKV